MIRAKKRYKYFASQSAVPTFKNIVQILVDQEKLIPDPEVIKKMEEEDMYESEAASGATEHSVKTQTVKKKKEPVKKKRKTIKKKVKQVKKVKKVKKPQIQKVLKEPAIPTTQPAPAPVQQYDNIEDLF